MATFGEDRLLKGNNSLIVPVILMAILREEDFARWAE